MVTVTQVTATNDRATPRDRLTPRFENEIEGRLERLAYRAEACRLQDITEATGFSPIDYVQRLCIEDAKRRLERTETSADAISWEVGYEDAAFFRRLFKRVTGMTPGAYRRRFQVPSFARSREKSG